MNQWDTEGKREVTETLQIIWFINEQGKPYKVPQRNLKQKVSSFGNLHAFSGGIEKQSKNIKKNVRKSFSKTCNLLLVTLSTAHLSHGPSPQNNMWITQGGRKKVKEMKSTILWLERLLESAILWCIYAESLRRTGTRVESSDESTSSKHFHHALQILTTRRAFEICH